MSYEKEGYKSKGYLKAQGEVQDQLMAIRFTAKMVEKLCDMLRAQVDEVRTHRRADPRDLRQRVRHAARALPPEVPRQRNQPELGGEEADGRAAYTPKCSRVACRTSRTCSRS